MKLRLGKIKCDEFKWKLPGMWWSEGCGTVTQNATRIHKIMLFPVQVGQPGQEDSLCK